jgi:hypothetical protein
MSARGRGELLSARVTPSNLRSSPSFPTIVVLRLEFPGGGYDRLRGIEAGASSVSQPRRIMMMTLQSTAGHGLSSLRPPR